MSFFNVIRCRWYEMRIRAYVLDRVDFLLNNPLSQSDDPADLTLQLVDLKSIVLGYLQLIYAVHEPTDVSIFVSTCARLASPTGSTVPVLGSGASTTEIGYVVAFGNLAKCGKCEFKIRIHKMQSMSRSVTKKERIMRKDIKPGYEMRIRRNSPEEQVMKDNAVNMLSYFAKEHTKESISSGYQAYGASRIPAREQE